MGFVQYNGVDGSSLGGCGAHVCECGLCVFRLDGQGSASFGGTGWEGLGWHDSAEWREDMHGGWGLMSCYVGLGMLRWWVGVCVGGLRGCGFVVSILTRARVGREGGRVVSTVHGHDGMFMTE